MTSKALIALSTIALTSAFAGVAAPRKTALPTQGVFSARGPFFGIRTSSLSALIYGWDDAVEETDESSSLIYSDVESEVGLAQCSPIGVAVAESLSYDRDRVGSLARLAVAFSPPERKLSLHIIEKVDVICVREDHIDIQAVVCEGGGCISLAVPIKFPYACDSQAEWLEGCVKRNLEELDESAKSTLLTKKTRDENKQDLQDLCLLDSTTDFPSWWVPPACDEAMAVECNQRRTTLNEDEFQSDIIALAQDSLNHAGDCEGYVVKAAKVTAVGPAGLCFKVRAEYQLSEVRPTHVLDVMYPFGGQPLEGVEALRAAVLGVVATAEGEPEP